MANVFLLSPLALALGLLPLTAAIMGIARVWDWFCGDRS